MGAYMLAVYQTGDYDAFKQTFDSDPAGRRQSGKRHRLFRSVDNPNEVFVGIEFDSVEGAQSFCERLRASGALDTITLVKEPTVAELVEEVAY
jgi:hypothetical protein